MFAGIDYACNILVCYQPRVSKIINNKTTYFINIQIPVFSIALDMPFHDANMEYFCLAVNGSLGSVAGGGPSGITAVALAFPRLSDAANFPN